MTHPDKNSSDLSTKRDGFTPGPWKVIASPHGRGYRCVQIGTDESYTTLEMLPGDARLIAAAPELFDALEQFAILGHGKCTIGKPLAEMARAALAKARGQS